MSSYPSSLKYTQSHEWIRAEGDEVVVGITWFAQDSLGDVVHVELPRVGTSVKAGQAIAEVESVKAVSDIYAPVSGDITAVNEDLDGSEETVNKDPYGGGWLFRIRVSDASEQDNLLGADAYRQHVDSQ